MLLIPSEKIFNLHTNIFAFINWLIFDGARSLAHAVLCTMCERPENFYIFVIAAPQQWMAASAAKAGQLIDYSPKNICKHTRTIIMPNMFRLYFVRN